MAGYRNTKLFYAMASHRRCQNSISSMESESGRVIEDMNEMKEEFIKHYSKLWQVDDGADGMDGNVVERKLNRQQRQRLSRMPDDQEIWYAVKRLAVGKAPGVDGFGTSFLKAYWSIVKDVRLCSNFSQ